MKTVSLFSGIGGLDEGFIKKGFNVIWANDMDKYAVTTYRANYRNEIVQGDITKIPMDSIPYCDVLIGGFPCQPFSMMGEQKGFKDQRGTVFFRIAEILKYMDEHGHKPRAVILENVRNLKTHDHGTTFKVIESTLKYDLHYTFSASVLNSADYGVPQTRKRTYMVCFSNPDAENIFQFPKKKKLRKTLQDLLESDVDSKYFLSDRILPTILSTGTGGYYSQYETDLKIARPLCATMAKMHRAGQDNYVTQNGRLRRLTPRECARLQGFSDSFRIPVSDTQAYKEFGNAVTVNVAAAVAGEVRKTLEILGEWK